MQAHSNIYTHMTIGTNTLDEIIIWLKENRPSFKGELKSCKSCNPYSEEFLDNLVSLFPEEVDRPFGAGSETNGATEERFLK